MRTLSIDIETYSDVDLKDAGLGGYVQSPSFQIMLFAYSYSADGGVTQVVDLLEGEKIPGHIVEAMSDPDVIKHAYNANFEIACLSTFYHIIPSQWHCTMVHAHYLRHAGSLSAVNEALDIDEEHSKLSSGAALISYFCKPCKPTKANGGRTRNLPRHDRAKWHLFKEYCRQDVVAEKAVQEHLKYWPMPDHEWEHWQRDHQINGRGIKLDIPLVKAASAISAERTQEKIKKVMELTGIKNPKSSAQLRAWLSQRLGKEVASVNKQAVQKLRLSTDDPLVHRVLDLREELGRSSVSKYDAMLRRASQGDRLRWALQFYGTNTGRWRGRGVQVQNLPRNHLEGKALDLARKIVRTPRANRSQSLGLLYGDVQDTLAQIIRTAFIPSEGCRFIVADYAAIEARVIAWLAKETWRLEVFQSTGKIYEASAAQMFGVPVGSIVPGHENYALRNKGKVAELALGYQGSVGALRQMGALEMGLEEDELPDLVQRWRDRSPQIVKLWSAVDEAAILCVQNLDSTQKTHGLTFEVEMSPHGLYLTIALPSGRQLFFPSPGIGENRWGHPSLTFQSYSRIARKVVTEETYGGKITENIVQAIARDCLAEAIKRLEEAGYPVVMHIHDEVVLDVPKGRGSLEEVIALMTAPMPWAKDLPLAAAGFEADYYKKD